MKLRKNSFDYNIQRNKILRNNFNRGSIESYVESHKKIIERIKEDLNYVKDIPCL